MSFLFICIYFIFPLLFFFLLFIFFFPFCRSMWFLSLFFSPFVIYFSRMFIFFFHFKIFLFSNGLGRSVLLNFFYVLFLLSAFLWNFFLCQGCRHGGVPPHLVQPCYVALGWALDSGLISRHELRALSIVFLFPQPSIQAVAIHCTLWTPNLNYREKSNCSHLESNPGPLQTHDIPMCQVAPFRLWLVWRTFSPRY